MSTTASTIHEAAPDEPMLVPPTRTALRVTCPVCKVPAGEDCALGPFRAYSNGTIHSERLPRWTKGEPVTIGDGDAWTSKIAIASHGVVLEEARGAGESAEAARAIAEERVDEIIAALSMREMAFPVVFERDGKHEEIDGEALIRTSTDHYCRADKAPAGVLSWVCKSGIERVIGVRIQDEDVHVSR